MASQQAMTDVELLTLYNTVLAGIAEIHRQAKEEGDVQARILLSRLAEFLGERTAQVGPPEMSNWPVGFPPEMTTEDIAGEVPLRFLMRLAHRGNQPGDCEAADELAHKIVKTIQRAKGGTEGQNAALAIFRLAHSAAHGLLDGSPDFVTFLRAYGVTPAAEIGRAAMQTSTAQSTAAQLFDYMEFRAQREGRVHDLTVGYYQQLHDKGFTRFFGVVVGPDGLEADRLRPELFEEWKRDRMPGPGVIQGTR